MIYRLIINLRRDNHGFTLIELMVVIVILGILTTVGMQQYGTLKTRAANISHNANVRILQGAARLYLLAEEPAAGTYQWTGDQVSPDWAEYISEWPQLPEQADIGSSLTGYTVNLTVNADGTNSVTVEPPRVDE